LPPNRAALSALRRQRWIGRPARGFAVTVLTIVGALLVLKGVLELL
jgi:hypothetical protein